jgi:hypothetical protein
MADKERCKGKTKTGEPCQILANESGFCRIHEPFYVDMRNEKISNKEILTGCLPMALFPIALIILMPIINGFVLSFLWEWFIIPIFHAPKISVVQAIGIALIFHFLAQNKNFYEKKKQSENDDKRKISSFFPVGIILFQTVFSPIIVFLMGWIIHFFV